MTFESTGTDPASTTIELSLSDGVNTVPVTLTINIVAPSGPIAFAGGDYLQNFDNLLPTPIPDDNVTIPSAMVLPAGWVVVENNSNANDSIRIDAGARTTGDSYLYGETGSNERALGSQGSGSMAPVHFGAALVNTSGQTIGSFSLSYVGEQWRRGSNNVDELTFAYSTTAASLTGTGFIEVNDLGFFPVNTGDPQPPTGTLDGNAPENQTNISHEVSGVDWQAGQVLWIRWTDINSPGADSGLAIDNVQFSATALANPTLTLTAPNAVYTSVAYAGAEVTITGAADPEPVPALTYYVGTEATTAPLDSAPINVGTYTVVASTYAITFNGAIFEIVADAAPTAVDDAYEVDEDTVLVVTAPGVLANDVNPAGGPLTAALCNPPEHGYLAFNPATGAFSYRPFENFHGQDTFTYFAVSGALRSDPATVTITVRPVNDPPVARDDLYTVVQGEVLNISAAGGLLANDTDADGDVLTVRNVSAVSGGGNLTVNDDGSAQRSMVQSLNVTFAAVVDLQAEHFRLVNRDTGTEVDLLFARDDASGKSVVTLTFTGAGIVGGSLADGNYLLTIDLEKDGIGVGDDHQFGASQADNFFRLFGDSDRDRDVDNLDYFRLRGALGHASDSPRYLDYFDYDQDDDVDSDDLAEFLARFRTALARIIHERSG